MVYISKSVMPVFGFKSASSYSDEAVLTGYEMLDFNMTEECVRKGRELAKIDKISKIIGYFPVVGTVMGMRRLKACCCEIDPALKLNPKSLHIVRGTIELASIGIVLFPLDLFATFFYNPQKEEPIEMF